MALLLHITIAFTSILVSGLAFMRLSRSTLRASYAFIAATFASGTYLIVVDPAHLTTACLSGLTYLAFVSSVTIATHVRLAKQEI
jgi:hypothetical protein